MVEPIALYLDLPDLLIPGPRLWVPTLEGAELAAHTVVFPRRTEADRPIRSIQAIVLSGSSWRHTFISAWW